MTPGKRKDRGADLIAPCGMNCGTCIAYLRERNRCPGCRSPDAGKAVTRVRCRIKTCSVFLDRRIRFCSGCSLFPCDRLRRLDRRYRTKYGMSMIGNLECIRDEGPARFLEREKERWTCPVCGGVICVHRGACFSCGLHSIRRAEDGGEPGP